MWAYSDRRVTMKRTWTERLAFDGVPLHRHCPPPPTHKKKKNFQSVNIVQQFTTKSKLKVSTYPSQISINRIVQLNPSCLRRPRWLDQTPPMNGRVFRLVWLPTTWSIDCHGLISNCLSLFFKEKMRGLEQNNRLCVFVLKGKLLHTESELPHFSKGSSHVLVASVNEHAAVVDDSCVALSGKRGAVFIGLPSTPFVALNSNQMVVRF